MKIGFDETNLLAGMVGEEHGITPAEWSQNQERAREALSGFRKLSESGEIGFPHLPFQTATVDAVRQYAAEVRKSYESVCLVGIGGSALGAWALDCGMRGPHPVQGSFTPTHPRLVILDNVDPSLVSAALASMNPKKTLVLAIAKSGGTPETVAAFLIVHDWLERAMGRKTARRIAVVTSQGRGDLAALAAQEGYRTFCLPDNVGGRFSVLSAVGLLPAALIGIDIRKLVRGAASVTRECWQQDLKKNTALRSALCHYLVWTLKKKSIQVAFPYSNRLWGAAFWFRQLWAESLGKARNRAGALVHTGQTPVAALGTTDQHSQVQLYIEGPNDKVFTFWRPEKYPETGKIPKRRFGLDAFDYLAGQTLAKLIDAEQRSTAAALTEAGRPNCAFTLGRMDEEHLGGFLQLLEFQTAFMGELLGINAFDQEGVELGKRFTSGLMGRKGFDEYLRNFQDYERRRAKITR